MSAERIDRPSRYYGKVCSKHPELNGARRTSNHSCLGCLRISARAWQDANPDRCKEHQRQKYIRHSDKIKAGVRRYRQANWDAIYEKLRLYRANNHELVKERIRKWGKENRHKRALDNVMRRAKLRQVIPTWITPAQTAEMKSIYRVASEHGQSVDHIIPVSGCRICAAVGLHVPWNLQLMDGLTNTAKKDRCQDCFDAERGA